MSEPGETLAIHVLQLQSGRRVLAVAQRLPAGQEGDFLAFETVFSLTARSAVRLPEDPPEANVESCAPPNDPAACLNLNLEKHSAYTFGVLSESPGRCAASSAPLKPIFVLSPQCFPTTCTRKSGMRASSRQHSETNGESQASHNDSASCKNLEKHFLWTYQVLPGRPGDPAAYRAPCKPTFRAAVTMYFASSRSAQ